MKKNAPRKSTHRSPARFIARVLPGARPGPLPGFVAPCIPTLKLTVPTGERWLYEIKHDGYRMQARLEEEKPSLLTSSGLNRTGRFKSIVASLRELPANSVVIDGEAVVPDDTGVANFSLLQSELSAGRSNSMVFYAFDLLYLDGFDIRAAPLVDRRRVLAELIGSGVGNILFSAHTEGDGKAIYQHACAIGLEGLVCKLQDSPYRSGKSTAWLKVKCIQRDTFSIVGFSPDRESVASLLLAKRKGGSLEYVGKADTGFTRKAAHDLYRLLHPLAAAKPALAVRGRHPNTIWVRPEYEAEIDYRAITVDGLLRHAAFKGLRPRARTIRTAPAKNGYRK